ncbi:MAG: hypothetical protein R3A80_02670 [Bdellovibrionota bacterium]
MRPVNLIKNNPEVLVATTFVAGLGVAFLASMLLEGRTREGICRR